MIGVFFVRARGIVSLQLNYGNLLAFSTYQVDVSFQSYSRKSQYFGDELWRWEKDAEIW